MLNISWLCRIAGVSRFGYCRWLGAQSVRDARDEQDRQDFALIPEAYEHRGYDKGARGIHMRLLHLQPPVIMTLKRSSAHGTRTTLLTDITYIPRKDGAFSYLSTILDAYTKRCWLMFAATPWRRISFRKQSIDFVTTTHW